MQIGEIAAEGVLRVRTLMANVYMVRTGSSWVLVDAGLGGYARTIMSAADQFIGPGKAPEAIVLTHGHFDHIGSLQAILEEWPVPVYAHRLERPYLNGESAYPPPDPLVGRGSMALLSRLYPRGPIDVGNHLNVLPDDGSVPAMPGWRWIFTPGHTAGHVSLFRAHDSTLIAGDAVVTTKQESAIAVMMQREEMHGPPAYFTQDWKSSAESVRKLAALEPEVLATGHGVVFRGAPMRQALHALAANFEQTEVPQYGRYAKDPAVTDEHGVVRLPPDPFPKIAAGLAAAVVAFGLMSQAGRLRRSASR
ncbi:MAG TPA: MBL fold metallo-hydrolase [Vicinamibacterales bacterium]|nr:MBL fold metallo-hydrolase [Vicinamibacterales bacterium]